MGEWDAAHVERDYLQHARTFDAERGQTFESGRGEPAPPGGVGNERGWNRGAHTSAVTKMSIRSFVAVVYAGSLFALCVLPAQASDPSDAGLHTGRITAAAHDGMYSSDRYIIGNGHGDLTKGEAVCRRVAELSARSAVARQIRVLVKERMIDRVRERSGRDLEQDIELTREEIVQEYVRGVSIVEYRIDEVNETCSATAVMLKE